MFFKNAEANSDYSCEADQNSDQIQVSDSNQDIPWYPSKCSGVLNNAEQKQRNLYSNPRPVNNLFWRQKFHRRDLPHSAICSPLILCKLLI